ncbi:MAG: hypothetical protein RMJ43_06475 [Chloroherpetonaceae bacterium]|nr:hypothetical protein [Chthonomonadaceae bacterium]MDW8207464.1 hypothetical protein [Chloroherpetonaceae bacterium]
MKFELQILFLFLVIGLLIKRIDWRGQFFLFLFLCTWIYFNWRRG